MNNFDENKEFVVRRPRTEQNDEGTRQTPPQRPKRPPEGTPRRLPPDGTRPRTPAGTPQGTRNGAPRPASDRIGATRPTPTRPTSPHTAPQRPQRTPTPPPKKAPQVTERQIDRKPSDLLKNILIFLGMLVILLAIGLGVILSTLYVAPEKSNDAYTIIYESENDIPTVVVNKVLYINMSDLAETYGFTVSGSKACLRYTASKGEYVEFTVGNRSAKVNGDIVTMSGAALVRDGDSFWIPLAFAESYFDGLLFTRNEDERTITITRPESAESTPENPKFIDITFKIKGTSSLPGIPEDPDIGDIVDIEFVNDLSEYEQYMNPQNRDDYLILVNKTTTISADDIPENLVSIKDVRKDGRKEQMVECAEKALEALFIEMRSAGYKDVSVTSGYRSYNKQSSLFTTYLQREMANNPSLSEEEARAIVLTYSAYPGTSEHQTGLACDMHNLSSADVAFAKKEAYKWLKENAHKFGFILRFPEDKVDITGYSFEPWHYRFVGRYHATRIYKLGMCLEEYVSYLSKANN